MSEKAYVPPYKITDAIVALISKISEQVGAVSVSGESAAANPRLRRDNRIKTIHSSLAIENNSLTLAQVTDVINGKRVAGARNEIREVKNAYEAYGILPTLDPFKIRDMLKAHRALMSGLSEDAGSFRAGGVGVFAGKRLVHAAPPAKIVPKLMDDLICWAKKSGAHPLVKACVFHYEFEFIHPFSDGNGRMGRMWQTLLLSRWKPVFAWLPAETLVRKRQREYYGVLAASDAASDSTAFVEYMLRVISDALDELLVNMEGARPVKVKKVKK